MSITAAQLLVEVKADTSNAEASLTNLGKSVTQLAGLGALGPEALGAAAVVGLGAAAEKSAADFEYMTEQVRNNTTMTIGDLDLMRSSILRMGSESGASLTDLGQGFMHIQNLGFSAAESTTILDTAMKSAVSSGGSMAATSNMLANVMHEFGISADQSAHSMDVLHTAAALGNMTLEQLTENGGQALAMAANMGVSMNDAAAALSAMTRHGFDAAQAATQVKDMIAHIVAPSQAARKEIELLAQTTGVDLTADFSQAGLASKGLIGVLDDMQQATAGNSAEILRLIPNMRGGLAAITLTGTGAKDLTDILGTLNETTGKLISTDERYQETLQTTEGRANHFKGELGALAVAMGTGLAGAANTGMAALDGLANEADIAGSHIAAVLDKLHSMGVGGGGGGFDVADLIPGGAAIETVARGTIQVIQDVSGSMDGSLVPAAAHVHDSLDQTATDLRVAGASAEHAHDGIDIAADATNHLATVQMHSHDSIESATGAIVQQQAKLEYVKDAIATVTGNLNDQGKALVLNSQQSKAAAQGAFENALAQGQTFQQAEQAAQKAVLAANDLAEAHKRGAGAASGLGGAVQDATNNVKDQEMAIKLATDAITLKYEPAIHGIQQAITGMESALRPTNAAIRDMEAAQRHEVEHLRSEYVPQIDAARNHLADLKDGHKANSQAVKDAEDALTHLTTKYSEAQQTIRDKYAPQLDALHDKMADQRDDLDAAKDKVSDLKDTEQVLTDHLKSATLPVLDDFKVKQLLTTEATQKLRTEMQGGHIPTLQQLDTLLADKVTPDTSNLANVLKSQLGLNLTDLLNNQVDPNITGLQNWDTALTQAQTDAAKGINLVITTTNAGGGGGGGGKGVGPTGGIDPTSGLPNNGVFGFGPGQINPGTEAGSSLPHFATGTNSAPGGLAMVHRDEVLNLPRGSSVTPLSHIGGGSDEPAVHIHFHGNVYGLGDFEDAVEKAMVRNRRRRPGTVG